VRLAVHISQFLKCTGEARSVTPIKGTAYYALEEVEVDGMKMAQRQQLGKAG
jgi:hypothetical protein